MVGAGDRELRRWQLDVNAPYTLVIAADARLSVTDYADDQTWELLSGAVDSPALQLRSAFGKRVQSATITPAFWHNEREIRLHQTYAVPPVVTAFAPGYVCVEGKLTAELTLVAEYWVMESHAVGATYTIKNTGHAAENLRVDLLAHLERDDRDLSLAIVALADGTSAISFGRLTNIEPIIVLKGAKAISARRQARIGAEMTIEAGASVQARWVHAGLNRMAHSLDRAEFWLAQDWDKAIQQIKERAAAIPQIETGHPDFDTVIAFSYQTLLQSVMRPTANLPYASLIASRQPERGFSPRGDGRDAPRGWNGQNIFHVYSAALALASVDPAAAQGILKNYLSVQADDGAIDLAPGLGGQRAGLLCPPLLARLAWNLYQLTEDFAFLEEVFPKLLAFFNRWAMQDVDSDLDTMPEFQDERQTGYVFWPTFGMRETWAQNADIRHTESPDMAAYLLSEGMALSAMARELSDPGAYELMNRLSDLNRFLAKLWKDDLNRYAYQERDTDLTTRRVDVVVNMAGDEGRSVDVRFDRPSRLIIRVVGGSSRSPMASIKLEGYDQNGERIRETVALDDKRWGYNFGATVSQHLYTQVTQLATEGLIRLYKVTIHSVDYSRLDINALLPLMLEALPTEKFTGLLDLLTDHAHFWRKSGLTIVSAQDPNFDPASARGGGGVWLHWLTLIGEGLLANEQGAVAARMVKTLLATQVSVLKAKKRFYEFYHADEMRGLGEAGYLTGIAPLYLLNRVLGVQIINKRRVYTGGAFHWGQSVTVRQHGVTVTRSESGTKITFPSGYTTSLNASAPFQRVEDRNAPPILPIGTEIVTPPPPSPTGTFSRVVIEVTEEKE